MNNLSEYIDAKQFFEQPKEIQEKLRKYHNEYHKTPLAKHIPLFGETELRLYIQSKLDGPSIYYNCGELVIEYEVNKGIEDCDVAEYKVECDDLLEGYWKVACMIAQEELIDEEFYKFDDIIDHICTGELPF